jgi:hypothetical protein
VFARPLVVSLSTLFAMFPFSSVAAAGAERVVVDPAATQVRIESDHTIPVLLHPDGVASAVVPIIRTADISYITLRVEGVAQSSPVDVRFAPLVRFDPQAYHAWSRRDARPRRRSLLVISLLSATVLLPAFVFTVRRRSMSVAMVSAAWVVGLLAWQVGRPGVTIETTTTVENSTDPVGESFRFVRGRRSADFSIDDVHPSTPLVLVDADHLASLRPHLSFAGPTGAATLHLQLSPGTRLIVPQRRR